MKIVRSDTVFADCYNRLVLVRLVENMPNVSKLNVILKEHWTGYSLGISGCVFRTWYGWWTYIPRWLFDTLVTIGRPIWAVRKRF